MYRDYVGSRSAGPTVSVHTMGISWCSFIAWLFTVYFPLASSREKHGKQQEEQFQSFQTEIQCIRSHIYNSLGMSKEAEKYARTALEMCPDSRDAVENLAKALKELQQYEKSEEMFLKAIDLQPIFTPTYNLLAFMRFSLANLTGAIDIASKGLERMENYSDLLYLKACSYHGLGQFKQAVEWYQKVIQLDRNHWAFYHIDLARFHQNMFDDPLWSWNLDRHFHSDFKERWSKREPSSNLKYYVNQPHVHKTAVPLILGQKLEPNLRSIYEAASLFKTKIQYNSPGFCKNEKQHRQSGIAIIHMAQVARSFWNSFNKGEIMQVNGFSQSSGTPEAVEHEFGWRDFFDITVGWRQISEPSDPVWWVDMLCEETFSEGYGAFTPVLVGESHVVRYYQYHDRMIGLMRELMPQQNNFTNEQKNACFEAKQCDDLYQLLLKDFYVHTNCIRLSDAGAQPLEGTRLTIQRNKNGYVLSIRTPCTPGRWKLFDIEMRLAWMNLAKTMKECNEIGQILKDILVVAFYWYNFMPLVRGTALCGLVAIHALLLAAGFQIKGEMPECLQIDWEAILNKDPDSFIACIHEWLDGNVVPLEQGFLDSVPSVEENINTLRKAFQILNHGFKLT